MRVRTRAVGRGKAAPPHPADRGAVLLEAALAIPALTAVAVGLAWCVCLGATYASLGDAARSAARALARGEASAAVLERARSQTGAFVSVEEAGSDAAVRVSKEVSPPVPFLAALSFTISQRVAIPREWT